MIEVKNLRKNFGPLDVLKDINLEIQDGEIYGLVGKSGAGKSTLLRCVNGLESYSAGSLKVNGVEVKDLDKNGLRMLRKDIGMIFQQFPMMTRKYNKTEIKSRVEELAEIVGIADKLKEKPTTLSGGQKQRVAIARALSMNPKILLSDEATSALDPTTTKAILNLLFEINQRLGITILVVTHQMEVVRQICGRMSLLENGEMTLSGEVDKLFLSGSSMLRQFLVNLRIMLLDDDHSRKMLSRIARELEVEYKICGGRMENYRGKQLGDMMINLEEKDALRVKAFLDEEKIIWHEC